MLDALLSPEVIAVVGASTKPGKVGHAIFSNLTNSGFKGRIIPVHPTAKEVLGMACVDSITAIEGNIDLSVIAVPTAAVKGAVVDSIQAGATGIVVITAGFREVGPEGRALEDEIAELCREKQVRLLGPNCLGLINTENRMNASFATQTPNRGSISVISQST